jgi:hypothetical protein
MPPDGLAVPLPHFAKQQDAALRPSSLFGHGKAARRNLRLSGEIALLQRFS